MGRAAITSLLLDVRAWADASLQSVRLEKSRSDLGATLAYIDLIFAFGFAARREVGPSSRLVQSARQFLEGLEGETDRGIAGPFLFKAFRYRVEQALAGKPHAGLLGPELMDELEAIHQQSAAATAAMKSAISPFRMADYAIARMLEHSRVLEPERPDYLYHEFMQHDGFIKSMGELKRVKNPDTLVQIIRDWYQIGFGVRPSPDKTCQFLVTALTLSVRVGEAFTVELLNLIPEVMRALAAQPTLNSTMRQGQLLERGLFLAAQIDRREIVHQLVDQFVELTKSKSDEARYELVNAVAGQSLRSLRRLGMRDEIDKLLRRMQDVILGGQPPAKLKDQHAAKPDLWGKALQSLLNLAGGWLTFGLTDQATPILDDARAELLGAAGVKLEPKDYTALAQAYVAAVGQGPADTGLVRIAELFRKMDPAKVTNSFTTSRFYSRFHLALAETALFASLHTSPSA